jgi:hypothetical protein
MLTGLQTINAPALVGTVGVSQRVGIREEMHLAKFGINCHFNSIADVVTAKY